MKILILSAIVIGCFFLAMLVGRFEKKLKKLANENVANSDFNTPNECVDTQNIRTMKVNIDWFFSKYGGAEYHHGLFIPEDIHALRQDCFLNGATDIEVPDNIFEIIEANKQRYAKRDSEYSAISQHRIAGMEREAEDDIDAAIIEYAESIRLGESAENEMYHAFAHSYARIIVLLDKVKRYAEEIDYIVGLLNHSVSDNDRSKYSARLEKTKEKLKKQCERGNI